MKPRIKKSLWPLISLLFMSTPCWSDINKFENKTLTVKPYIETPGFDLRFNPSEGDHEIVWQPNLRAVTGVALTYKDLVGIAGGFKNSLTSEDHQNKGDTTYQDWRFKFSFWELYFSAYYQEFKGLYIENSEDVNSEWSSGDPFLQYEDLKVQNISLNVYWTSRPKQFSIEAASDQTVRQEKSGGSFVAGLALSQFSFSNSDSMIPEEVQDEYGTDAEISQALFRSLTVSAGYGYTFVFRKNWYASALLLVGLGIRDGQFKNGDETSKGTDSATKADFLISLGYNGDEYFGGLSGYGDGTTYSTESMDITSTVWAVQLFAGTRF